MPRESLEMSGADAGVMGEEEATITEIAADLDWHELARAVRAKRFGAARPRDYKERARQARFLQYRGFDAAQIRSALEVDEDSD
jgi:regulatory protein